ncbi:outer membrane beta-barrel protein [Colwellia ponticola]|uniref:Porin family protein n=1 Tax=Colwellia ponticola TaxID=2304625 RepID=A0A8H2PK66_9GAMM|nr:outer membrane beta-barrel protein [Colwellia ponticola]TMM45436.1 porin family protein [Colwellia ponticola]
MKKIMVTMSAMAIFVMSSTAVANGTQWELTLGVGHSTADTQLSITPSGEQLHIVSLDDSGISINTNIAYLFDKHWYVSAGYLDLGNASVTLTADTLQAGTLKQELTNIGPVLGNGFTLSAGHKFWVSENIALDLQLGLFNWKAELTSTFDNNTIATDDTGTDLFLSVGARYQVSERWAISTNWQRFQLSDTDVDNINIALSYAF